MGKSLLELFKGSPQDKSVKSDKETLVEQELKGLRVKSAAEINNPLIYGNEAMRIANRSTPVLEDMKKGTEGAPGDGGLLGKGLSKLSGGTDEKAGSITSLGGLRDKINDKLGIPSNQIPSRIIGQIEGQTSDKPVKLGEDGNEVGKFLKETGGGNPSTILKQAGGKLIGKAKDKLRGAIFGEGAGIGSNDTEPVVATTTNERTYSDTNKSKKLKSEEGVKKDLEGTKLDLSLVSPIYGTQRKETTGRFGNTEYALELLNDSDGNPIWNTDVAAYDPIEKYTGVVGEPSPITENSLENRYGLTPTSDIINKLSPSDEYDKKEYEGKDLIPFWISHIASSNKPMFFRTLITGLSETVSPSWNTNSFVGNPYKFYTYTGVERNVTFNLKMYCMSPYELTVNWEKITKLTQLTYPFINKEKLMNAPIISFRIGDIYNSKEGFIESLTYTIPDDSNWETDSESGYLPKFIDVAITIKFIEADGAQYKPYGYKLSKEGAKALNEDRKAANFDTNSRVNSNGSVEQVQSLPKVDSAGIEKTSTDISAPTLGKGGVKGGVGGEKQKTEATPEEKDLGAPGPFASQPKTRDNLTDPDFKSPNEAVSKIQNKYNCNVSQALFIMRGVKFSSEPTKNPPFSWRSKDSQALYFQIPQQKKDWYYLSSKGSMVTLKYKMIKKFMN